jgi:hypothetical protein
MPPVSHFLYIPMVLMLGVAIGFIFGGRAARDAQAARARADEAKAARRAARDAARTAATDSARKSE